MDLFVVMNYHAWNHYACVEYVCEAQKRFYTRLGNHLRNKLWKNMPRDCETAPDALANYLRSRPRLRSGAGEPWLRGSILLRGLDQRLSADASVKRSTEHKLTDL